MSKLIILLVVASLVACISADDDDDDIPDPMDTFGFSDTFSSLFDSEKMIDSIKHLKKPDGGHVSGTVKTYSHKSETKNGVPTLDETNTDEVDNEDGDVKETKTSN